METFYVYILYSPKYDKYYIGQTPDPQTRLLFHNELSKKSFTSRYRPWECKKVIPVPNRTLARKMENYIKKRKSRSYLISLIENEQTAEKLLQRLSSSVA